MKRILKISLLAFTLMLAGSLRNSVSAQYDDRGQTEVSYQTFYDQLSPYGEWIDYPGYGYVWVPEVGDDFRPYSTNGHWVYTDDEEWMWVSDYDWGWAPFHYGRWEEDADYGWFWVPGYEWSPAWVAWRDGGDYYGWAPLRPGISISINFNIGSYNPPYDYWCFVPRRYITSPRIYDYYIDRSTNLSIINYTTIINFNRYQSGYGWRSGPNRNDAERYCGRINPVRFRDSYSPGRTFYRNNEVSFYRPNVRRDDRVAAPRQFERYDRNSGGFRNRDGNNNGRGGDNGFRRNNDMNGNNVYNGNGRSDQRDRGINDQPFRRNNDNNRQPGADVNGDRRGFDRNGNGRPGTTGGDIRPDDRRFNGGQDRNPNGNGSIDNNNRGFERRNIDNNGGGVPRRDPAADRVDQPRQFERRNVDMNRGNDQIYRRNDNIAPAQRQVEPRPVQQDQPRQFERRNDNPGGGRPQVNEQRQEQPRSFERRDDGNRGNGNGNGNGGEGRGKGRRF